MNLSQDFFNDLLSQFSGDIRTDPASRWLYSTDASIYQIQPFGVVFPRSLDDLSVVVNLAAKHQVPILARGAGSSLAGQAIGSALIIDCSRYLTKIHDITVIRENNHLIGGTLTAEPGVILNTLNKAAANYGLQFGPDPASAERATLGGSIANNATGAHSILYGMSADHLISSEVLLSDGTITQFAEREIDNCPIRDSGVESRIYKAALHIRDEYAHEIQSHWPRVWRRASGYNLNYLIPWIPIKPIGWNPSYNPHAIYNHHSSRSTINLAPLVAGSEGTLAVIRRATVQLVPIPKHTVLGILGFTSLVKACELVPKLLEIHHPSAIEVISKLLIQLARSVPAYAAQLSWVNKLSLLGKDPDAILVIEFSGENQNKLIQQVRGLGSDVLVADSGFMQKQVWAVRKVGLGILQSRPGEKKPVTFIEDLVVPVEKLGEFVREMERIMQEHDTVGDFYAHASAGCLHFRPILNIKSAEGIAQMRSIAEEAIDLVLRLGGSTSGEHGDGIARSEWLEKVFGSKIHSAFREIKVAADPAGILNPGKIIDAPRMDENLRSVPLDDFAWNPVMDFSRNGGSTGLKGFIGAIEMCNGAGVCRKAENVMCPSFQVTQDETYSTRGRANLLRALFLKHDSMTANGSENRLLDSDFFWQQKTWESLDLCLACKGCKSECPSGVDMAKLKYEFMSHYYTSHKRRIRDYLFGYIGILLPLGSLMAPVVNFLMRVPYFRRALDKYFGLSCQRPFPRIASYSTLSHMPRRVKKNPGNSSETTILLLRDAFNHYFYPDVEKAALHLLQILNVNVKILPVMGAGRTLISKGFLSDAKKHALKVTRAIREADPKGRYPVVGLEPSEIYTLPDEYIDFFPGVSNIKAIADRTWMLDEYLIRADRTFPSNATTTKVILHGHCYQRARPPSIDGKPTGVGATSALLNAVGYQVEIIDDGCCGMAGAFGYETEHYDISIGIGGLALFPTLREAEKSAKGILVSAPGVSCRAQIEDGTRIAVYHPIQLVTMVFDSTQG